MKRTEPQINIIDSKEKFIEALKDIQKASVISFDTETSGLDPRAPGAYITSLGISTKRHDWQFPLNHYQSKCFQKFNYQKRLVKKLTKAVEGKIKVAQNGKFDFLFLHYVFGVVWDVDFDTLLADYNLDENRPHGLEEQANREGWDSGYDIPLSDKHGITGTIKTHCQYLGKDTFYTLRLFYLHKKRLKEDQGSYNIFNHITMPASKLYCKASLQGVYIDKTKLQDAQDYWTERAKTSRGKLDKLHPSDNKFKNKKTKQWEYGINWLSPKQVGVVLFDDLDLDPLEKTAKGSRSTSESVLKRLGEEYETPRLILEYREATKNLSTFIESWKNKMYKSRIYPNFKISGTVTGRPACEEPNLQQTPRDPRVRQLIHAPIQEGYELLDVDYSQAELRLVAEHSKDPELYKAYQTGIDVHGLTVERIFGIPQHKQTKEQRKKGKAVNFGFVYGMQWKKFKVYARDNYDTVFTERESKQYRESYFNTYVGILPWHEKQKYFAKRNGYVRSLLGRKRRLPDAQKQPEGRYDFAYEEALRQAINSPIQSFASDLTLMSAIQIDQELPVKIVGSVHDSILMEVKIEDLPKVCKRITQIMSRPKLLDTLNINLTVPLEGEIEVGPWGNPHSKWDPKSEKLVSIKSS